MRPARLLAVVAANSVLIAMGVTGALVAQAAPPSGGPGPVIIRRDADGLAHSVRTTAGDPGRRPSDIGTGTPAESAARAHLTRHEALFGLTDQARELRRQRVVAGDGGAEIVRFQQQVAGVPVIGAELVVALDEDNNVESITGETTEDATTPSTPDVAAATAIKTAVRATAKAHRAASSTLTAGHPERWIYDPALIGAPGRPGARQVWRVEVSGGAHGDIRELMLVDAETGLVALHFNQIHTAKRRIVCDNRGIRNNDQVCQDGDAQIARVEGGPASTVVDVNRAYTYSGDTYDFYRNRLGRDSIDGAGMPLRSTVRFCPTGAFCPYQNAFWDGQGMTYGTGFANADDVVGHELTHGVVERTANLIYVYQSGAINESIADVMGELMDLTNGAGRDTNSHRWKLGEDLPASVGVIRNMKNPPAHDQPDRMTSRLYWADRGFFDNGGVHINSGVGNKAAHLMTDGGTFNGYRVGRIGVTKAMRVWYGALLRLTSGGDYADLADTLEASCASLRAAGTVTRADCIAVANAVKATEMRRQPKAAAAAPEAARCPSGPALTTLFSDDAEDARLPQWQLTSPYWTSVGAYAHRGRRMIGGYDVAGSGALNGSARTTTASAVALPADGEAYLHFHHSYDLRYVNSVGQLTTRGTSARVEYSANGGPWTDMRSLPSSNGYTTSRGFAVKGTSNGWSSTRFDLRSLQGKQVRIRFNYVGNGSSTGSMLGWNLDDIQIHTCRLKTTASLRARAATINYGASTTASGTLRRTGDGTRLAGKAVRLYQRRDGTSSWRLKATRTTTSTGTYAFAVKPASNYEYVVAYAGNAELARSRSAVAGVNVRPRVGIRVNDSTVRKGTTVTFRGSVAPAHRSRTVYLQRFKGGAWRMAKSARLSSTSAYTMRWRTDSRADHNWRVRLPAHSDHVPGTSKILRVNVR